MAQREIPCPNCSGPGSESSVIPQNNGRALSKISGWLQRTFSITLPTAIVDYIKERVPISRNDALNGKCNRCNGTRTIPDPSDDNEKYEQAGAIAQGVSREIEEKEALLGAGGNRYTIIAGSDLLEVGLGMNDAPSYRVDHGASVRNWGNAGPGKGKGQVDPEKAPLSVPRGASANHVQGLNPLASPGGHYVIKCSNKFTVITGAQGIDITTGGPITINGGITQITGPEVTVGTQTGKLALEGDVINMTAKSVEVAPTDGHFYVRGAISNSGDLMPGGHVHAESASVVYLETTGKMESTDTGSATNIYGGPAFWSIDGIIAAAREFASYSLINTGKNPNFLKTLATPRFWLSYYETVTNINYTLANLELLPTGICWTSVGPGMVWNFPHVHALPDGMHQHEMRVANIDCSCDSAKELRAKQAGIGSGAPMRKKTTSLVDVAVNTAEFIGSAFVAIASPIQHFTYKKATTPTTLA